MPLSKRIGERMKWRKKAAARHPEGWRFQSEAGKESRADTRTNGEKTPTGSHLHRSSLLAFVAQRRKSPGLDLRGQVILIATTIFEVAPCIVTLFRRSRPAVKHMRPLRGPCVRSARRDAFRAKRGKNRYIVPIFFAPYPECPTVFCRDATWSHCFSCPTYR